MSQKKKKNKNKKNSKINKNKKINKINKSEKNIKQKKGLKHSLAKGVKGAKVIKEVLLMKIKSSLKTLSLRVFLLVLINSIFYFKTFFSTLSIFSIVALIIATSLMEFMVFVLPKIKEKKYRIIQGFLFFFFSASKVLLSIYIMYYGNANIFSRSSQIENVSAISEYFIAQVTLANVSIVLLSFLVSILLYKNHDTYSHDVNKHLSSKNLLYSILGIYLFFAITLASFSDNEYYRSVSKSFLVSSFGDDSVLSEKDLENFESNNSKKMNEEINSLFKNYEHKNKYTGIAKDKNLLIIQVESLQNLFINKTVNGKELTPNLNKLIKKSFYFNDYFEMLGFGNSSDAEYVSLHSAFSTVKNGAYQDFHETDTFGLPKICKSKSYITSVMHGNTGKFYNRQNSHPKVGFDHTYYGEYYKQDEIIGMGLSDKSFFNQSLEIFEKNKDKKTLTFMITLTCHAPFYMPAEDIFFSDDKISGSTLERYYNALYYTDAAIGDLLNQLDEKGILENTVVCIYGDHHAFTLTNPKEKKLISDFLGHNFDYDEMLKIPLIIYVPGYEKEVLCENTGSQMDFLPTLLNLMGWNDTLTPMFGVDLLDDELSKGNVVYPQTYMLQGSYISKDEFFEKSRGDNQKGRLVNRETREESEIDRNETSLRSDELILFSNYIYYKDKIQEIVERFKKNKA